MASYTVAKSKHATLVAATVDTVNIPASVSVEVLNRSTDQVIYFTTNGVTPVAAADDTFIVLAGQSLTIPDSAVHGTAIKLISAGGPDYSVTVF